MSRSRRFEAARTSSERPVSIAASRSPVMAPARIRKVPAIRNASRALAIAIRRLSPRGASTPCRDRRDAHPVTARPLDQRRLADNEIRVGVESLYVRRRVMVEPKARIALAEDDVLLRAGLASLLERSGFEIVAQVGDGEELIAAVREHRPDVAIVDIRMPPAYEAEGLDAAQVIRREFPAIGILLLSAHVEVDQATELLAAGQRVGYLLKSRVTEVREFIETVERIAQGGSVVDPGLGQELLTARHKDDPLEGLTAREREVLALLAEGRSNAGIANRLWITEGTVEKHVRSILARMQLPETEDDHRRVLAVITFLDNR